MGSGSGTPTGVMSGPGPLKYESPATPNGSSHIHNSYQPDDRDFTPSQSPSNSASQSPSPPHSHSLSNSMSHLGSLFAPGSGVLSSLSGTGSPPIYPLNMSRLFGDIPRSTSPIDLRRLPPFDRDRDDFLSEHIKKRSRPSKSSESDEENEDNGEDRRGSLDSSGPHNHQSSGHGEDTEDLFRSSDDLMKPQLAQAQSSPASIGMHRLLLASPAISASTSASPHPIGLSLLGAIPPTAPLNSSLNLSFERLKASQHPPSFSLRTPIKTAARSPALGPTPLMLSSSGSVPRSISPSPTPLPHPASHSHSHSSGSPGQADSSLSLASFTSLLVASQHSDFLSQFTAIKSNDELSNRDKLHQIQEALKNVEKKIHNDQIKL